MIKFQFLVFLGHMNLATKLTMDLCVLEPHWTKQNWKWWSSRIAICQATFLPYGGSRGGAVIPKPCESIMTL